jgi:uncharacterized protein (TIGR02757 family)
MSHNRTYNGIPAREMKLFLEEKYLQFNNSSFIPPDPVSIPHRFTERKDIEISGFLTAAIAWGRRDLFLNSAGELIRLMDNSPYEFLINSEKNDLDRFNRFVYRTFNATDCICFLESLRYLYLKYESIEEVMLKGMKGGKSLKSGISNLRNEFFKVPHNKRSEKHFADPLRGSAGKRLNMFIRWMVRKDTHGVDFGIWNKIDPSMLYIPLDFHSGNSARKLGLLKRKTNDWEAVEELTGVLREFDPADPVKYDFALFGLGVNRQL